jgi:hypothetical protein
LATSFSGALEVAETGVEAGACKRKHVVDKKTTQASGCTSSITWSKHGYFTSEAELLLFATS